MTDTAAYDWSQFHLRMYYLAPLADVFRRFATAQGLESFFIYSAEHTSADGRQRGANEIVQSGDHYDWQYVHDYAHPGEFLRVEKDQLVAFTFGSMHVQVTFQQVDEAVEVHLHQTGCALEDPERAWQHLNCRSCWIYFLTNLRSVLAGGADLRDFEHPLWNDSVSIGFDVTAGPGVPRARR